MDMFKQHRASNYITSNGSKVTTDDYLVEDSPYFSQDRNKEEIMALKLKHDYFTITDEEVASLREMCQNKISRGEAVEMLIKGHVKSYKGLVDPNDEDEGLTASTAVLGAKAPNEQAIMKAPIETAMYSEGKTYYFLGK